MKTKTITLSTGKSITVFDGLLSAATRDSYYSFIAGSLFRPSGYDSIYIENRGDTNLFSGYTLDDVSRMGFLDNPELAPVTEMVIGMEFMQARVNLSTLNDRNRVHIDTATESKTIIYYPNPKWEVEWGGYTVFTDEAGEEIEHCLAYRAGRVIVFDGDIPHAICAPTNLAPSYRFSFVMQFRNPITPRS